MAKPLRLNGENFPDYSLAFQQLRHHIKVKRPYFVTELASMTAVYADEVPFVTVDQYWRIYFSAKFFKEVPFAEQAGLILKNMYHLVRLHFLRGNRLPVTKENLIYWLISCDLEVNFRVIEAKLKLPNWAIMPHHLGLEKGLLAEEYFRLIQDRDLQEAIDGLPGLGLPSCGGPGSGISGLPCPWDIPAHSAEFPSVLDGEGIQKATSAMNKDAQNSGRGDGALLQELIVELQEGPKLKWHQILPQMVRRAMSDFTRGGSKRTFRRPSRRAAISRIVLPRLISSEGTIGVVLDTSGSMIGSPIARAYAIIKDLCLTTGKRTKVLCCDADATNAQNAFSNGSFDLKIYGGGGTDMRVGIETFAKQVTPPDVVVVITDGDTPWPTQDKMPNFPVVAVIVGSGTTPPEYIKYVIAE